LAASAALPNGNPPPARADFWLLPRLHGRALSSSTLGVPKRDQQQVKQMPTAQRDTVRPPRSPTSSKDRNAREECRHTAVEYQRYSEAEPITTARQYPRQPKQFERERDELDQRHNCKERATSIVRLSRTGFSAAWWRRSMGLHCFSENRTLRRVNSASRRGRNQRTIGYRVLFPIYNFVGPTNRRIATSAFIRAPVSPVAITT
jgi:hypothetical protein